MRRAGHGQGLFGGHGYTQPAEIKQWRGGAIFTEWLPPPVDAVAENAARQAAEESDRSVCEKVLRAQFDFLSARHMVPRQWGGGFTRGRDSEGRKEDPWKEFQRRYGIPYLYGLIKTHKQPFGWRFISGGSNIALNLAGDWMHAALSALVGEVHTMAAKTLAGAVASDPMPCNESFIIRDSRDVVRRVRELERRRRAAYRAFEAGDGPRPQRWQKVEFEVADFTTLYPSLPHADILSALSSLLGRIFQAQQVDDNGVMTPRWLRVIRGGKLAPKAVSTVWVAGQHMRDGSYVAPEDRGLTRHFDADSIMETIRFILGHTFMTVGNEMHRQVCGIPMGLSCSPMLAVMMLAHYEIRMLERMRAEAEQPLGTVIDTPQGQRQLTAALRLSHLDLACRLSRSCRAIDDVLLIDMRPQERRWAMARMYPGALELKTVCRSPDRIQYLDLEIRHDRGGFHTVLYDKRDALRDEGKMDVVRRFPHPTSVLSEQCKYGCLVSFLHRAARCDTRQRHFVSHAAERMVEMFRDGYEASKLIRKLRRFVEAFHQPRFRARAICAKVEQLFSHLRGGQEQPTHAPLFPEGTPMAVDMPRPARGTGNANATARRLQLDAPGGSSGAAEGEAGARQETSPEEPEPVESDQEEAESELQAAAADESDSADDEPLSHRAARWQRASTPEPEPPTHISVMTPVSWLAQVRNGRSLAEEWEVEEWQPFDPADTSLDAASVPIVRAWVTED